MFPIMLMHAGKSKLIVCTEKTNVCFLHTWTCTCLQQQFIFSLSGTGSSRWGRQPTLSLPYLCVFRAATAANHSPTSKSKWVEWLKMGILHCLAYWLLFTEVKFWQLNLEILYPSFQILSCISDDVVSVWTKHLPIREYNNHLDFFPTE